MSARRRLLVPLLSGLIAAGALAQAPAPAPTPTPAPLTPAQQAALEALDRVLGRFASLAAKDDDPGHQASARATLGELERRRAALAAAFDLSRCDDLKAEAILDLQREAAWVRTGPPAATSPARN